MNTRGCTYWKAKVDWFGIHLFWHEKKKDENVFLEKPTVIVELPGCYKAVRRGSKKLRLPGSNSHRESYGGDSSFLFGDSLGYEKCLHLWWLLGPDRDREASLIQLLEAVTHPLAPLARKTKPRIQVFQGLRLNSSLAHTQTFDLTCNRVVIALVWGSHDKLGMVVVTCDPSSRKVEAREEQVWG